MSAGADQDLILEDLVRILDAYKYTLPIIKIGITKEVQSTGMFPLPLSPSPCRPPPPSSAVPSHLVFSFLFGLVCSLCIHHADSIKILLRSTTCYRDPPFSFLLFLFPLSPSLLSPSLFFFFPSFSFVCGYPRGPREHPQYIRVLSHHTN